MKKRIGVLIVDGAVAAGAAAFFKLWGSLAAFLPSCPIKEHLGLYCVGCGGTRFIYHLINFRFWIAFKNNPYLFFLGIYLVIALALANVYCFSGKPVHRWLLNEKWLWFWAIAGVLFFILRNVPVFPFTYLTPMKFW